MFYPQGSTTSCHQLSKPQLYSTETNESFTIVRMDKFSIHYGAINWHRILQMGIEKFWLCFLFLMALGYQRGGGGGVAKRWNFPLHQCSEQCHPPLPLPPSLPEVPYSLIKFLRSRFSFIPNFQSIIMKKIPWKNIPQ